MYDWNDLRFLLSVARRGSSLAAARALGVNHTTVARRLRALETALGVQLFERRQTGSRLTHAGSELVELAKSVERSAEALAGHAAAHARGLAGVVRVTAVEDISEAAVMPALADFRRLYPDITVEMIVTADVVDLRDGTADVALRVARSINDPDLVIRHIADLPWAFYASRDYITRCGQPRAPSDFASHQLVAGGPALSSVEAISWMLSHAPNAQVVHRASTGPNLVHAIKAGLGVGPLPRPLAALHDDLVECMPAPTDFDESLWIVIAAESKSNPRVRAFIDFIVPRIVALAQKLNASAEARRPTPAAAATASNA